MILACIVCGTQPEAAFPQNPELNQPCGATTFITHGQYGSTAFDEIDGCFLEINICDPCLTAAAAEDRVLHGTPGHFARPPTAYTPWRPPGKRPEPRTPRPARRSASEAP